MRFSLCILVFLNLHSIVFSNGNDISILSDRYISLLEAEALAPKKDIEVWFTLFKETGEWNDLNYKDQKPTNWEPREHWIRIRTLAELYYNKDPKYDPKLLLNQINPAIDYWIDANLACSNGWYNAMGVPIEMASTLLLLNKEITTDRKNALIELMNNPPSRGKTGVENGEYYYGTNRRATGQNLAWLASIHIQMGIATQNEEWIFHAVRRLEEVLEIKAYEGIQADYSFHQHGPQLYSGGYGLSFTETVGNLVTILHGTQFSMPKDREQTFIDFILKGQAWMCRNKSLDNQCKGREITRPNRNAEIIGITAQKLSQADFKEAEELSNLANEILQNGKLSKSGVKNFWRSDLMMLHNENFSLSIAGTSQRLRGSEHLNGENDLGYYIPHGSHFIYRNEEDLDELMPCYDFRRIPGSLITEEAFIPKKWSRKSYGSTLHVGGVTDSIIGCFAYDYNWEGIRAKRAWFLSPEGIIGLVANVNSSQNKTLIQTINQTRAKGKTLIDTGDEIKRLSELNGEKLKAVFHNDMLYTFPQSRLVKLTVEERSGSWQRINKTRSSEEIKEKVFQLSFPLQEKDKLAYSYRIYPKLSEEDFRKGYQSNWDILENNERCQSVWNNESQTLQAIFYQGHRIQLPTGQKLTTRSACNLILKYEKDYVELIVSDPTKSQEHIEIKLSGKLKEPDKQVRGFPLVELPKGKKRGSEISIKINYK